jgi:hypothetical protein
LSTKAKPETSFVQIQTDEVEEEAKDESYLRVSDFPHTKSSKESFSVLVFMLINCLGCLVFAGIGRAMQCLPERLVRSTRRIADSTVRH